MQTLKQLSGSHKLRIKLAILETMEKAGFKTNGIEPDLKENGTKGNWSMSFQIGHISVKELQNIQEELGLEMFVEVKPVNKECLAVIISAEEQDFVNLLSKPIGPAVIQEGTI